MDGALDVFPVEKQLRGRRSDMISFKKIPFKLLVKTRTLIIQHHIFCQSFGCRAVRFEDVLILILTNRSSSVFSRGLVYVPPRTALLGEHVWEAFGILQSHIRQRAKWPELVLPRRISSGKQGLVGWHGRSLQGGHVSECFSVNRGMVINPTFWVGVYYLQKTTLVRISRHEGCDEFIPDNTSDVLSFRWFLFPDSTMHQIFHHHVAEDFVGHSFPNHLKQV